MSNKFTPGEWKAHCGINEPDFVYYGDEENCSEEGRIICDVNLQSNEFPQRWANVQLIAAAPKMLEALEKIRDVFAKNCCIPCKKCYELQGEIDEVLKKVRGEK